MSQLSNRIAQAIINYSNSFKEDPSNRELAEKELKDSLRLAIDHVTVPIYLDNEAAKFPEYAHCSKGEDATKEPHATDAGCDVVATSVEVTSDGRIKCGTGIHVATEYRDCLDIRPNSRITKAGLVIANTPCTVDESYRGEIFIVFRSITMDFTLPKVGDVIGQFMISHPRQIRWFKVNKLEDLGITERGDGAFGSTKK